MNNFCSKCGSMIDQNTGLCPNCDSDKYINFSPNVNLNDNGYADNNQYQNNNENLNNNGYINENGYINNNQYPNNGYIQNNYPNNYPTTYKKKRKKPLIITIIILCLILILGGFFALDYFGIINTKVCESLGLKSAGNFIIESDKTVVYVKDSGKNNVTFFCNPNVEFDSIELHCDTTDTTLEDFADDGNFLKSGDMISGDGIYSSMVDETNNTNSKLSYYALIKKGLKYYKSNTIEIEVKDSLSSEDISKIDDSQSKVKQFISSNKFKAKTDDEKKKSVSKFLNDMAKDNGVIDKKSISYDDNSHVYTYKYKTGSYGCVQVPSDDNSVNYPSNSTTNTSNNDTNNSNQNSSSGTNNSNNNSSQNSTQSTTSNNNKSNAKVTIMYDLAKGNSDILNMYKQLQTRWQEKGVNVELIANPTVSDYSSKLSGNSLILMATKGSKITLPNSQIANNNSYSAICTNEEVTAKSLNKYKDDLGNNNIMCVTTENGTYYWLLPTFFSNHYGNNGLKDSILLFENSYSKGNKGQVDFSLSVNSTGASSMLGYTNDVTLLSQYSSNNSSYYVDVNNTRNYYMKRYGALFTETIADKIINSSSINDAIEDTKKVFGNTQYDYLSHNNFDYTSQDNKICPTLVGNKKAKLKFDNTTDKPEVSDFILSKDDFILISDGNSITLKSSVLDDGRKIYEGSNTGHMLSDGKHLFFVNSKEDTSSSNSPFTNYTYTCYSMNLDGSNVQEEFTAKNQIEFVTYKDGYLYYIDHEFESGKLMRISPSFDNSGSTSSENIGLAEKACVVGNTIVFSDNRVVQNVSQITQNTVNVYHMDTNKTELLSKGSSISDELFTNNYIYMSSFKYNGSKNLYTNSKLQIVDKEGKIDKEILLSDGYVPVFVSKDDSYIILRDMNAYGDRNKYETMEFKYYKLDLITENISEIENKDNLSADFIHDLYTGDTYCKLLSPNGCASDVDGDISILQDNKLVPCKGNNDYTIRFNSSKCKFIDGLYVDMRTIGEFPDNSYEQCLVGLSAE